MTTSVEGIHIIYALTSHELTYFTDRSYYEKLICVKQLHRTVLSSTVDSSFPSSLA